MLLKILMFMMRFKMISSRSGRLGMTNNRNYTKVPTFCKDVLGGFPRNAIKDTSSNSTAHGAAARDKTTWGGEEGDKCKDTSKPPDARDESCYPIALDIDRSTATGRQKSIKELLTSRSSCLIALDVDNDWAIEIWLKLGAARASPCTRALQGVEQPLFIPSPPRPTGGRGAPLTL
jgi:hypothetical protein